MVILRNKRFSSKRENREEVPEEIIKKAKKDGVVQEYNGKWRIVSFKTNPPTFWDSHYTSKEKATAALAAYHCQK